MFFEVFPKVQFIFLVWESSLNEFGLIYDVQLQKMFHCFTECSSLYWLSQTSTGLYVKSKYFLLRFDLLSFHPLIINFIVSLTFAEIRTHL